jgi:hypothetical protein
MLKLYDERKDLEDKTRQSRADARWCRWSWTNDDLMGKKATEIRLETLETGQHGSSELQ